MEEERKSWALLIRSWVISSKEPLTPNEINNDMKKIEGKSIPYKQLKYNSLVEMLKDINGLKVFKADDKTLVKAIASKETAHIQKMVKRQKNSKKIKKKLSASTPPQRYNTRQSKVHEPPTNIRLDRPQNTQNQNNASLPPHFEQSTTASSNATLQPQQYQQQPILLVQPVIQVVPYLTFDPQLMGLSLQFMQHLPAPNFQYISQPSHSLNSM